MAVTLHEFGHSLGLGHTAVLGSVMNPFYTGSRRGLRPMTSSRASSLSTGRAESSRFRNQPRCCSWDPGWPVWWRAAGNRPRSPEVELVSRNSRGRGWRAPGILLTWCTAGLRRGWRSCSQQSSWPEREVRRFWVPLTLPELVASSPLIVVGEIVAVSEQPTGAQDVAIIRVDELLLAKPPARGLPEARLLIPSEKQGIGEQRCGVLQGRTARNLVPAPRSSLEGRRVPGRSPAPLEADRRARRGPDLFEVRDALIKTFTAAW